MNKILPGNKGVPEPRPGYEQRKVLPVNYAKMVQKGYSVRFDDHNNEILIGEFMLCERPLSAVVEFEYKSDDTAPTLPANLESGEVITSNYGENGVVIKKGPSPKNPVKSKKKS